MVVILRLNVQYISEGVTMIWKNLLACTLALLCSFFVYAAPAEPLSISEHNQLVPSRICLDSALRFQKKGVLVGEAYATAVAECLTQARVALGRDISAADLTQKVGMAYELTAAQKFAGALSSLSWMQGFFAVVGAIAGAIFLFHCVPVFKWIPKGLYEVLFYVTSLGLTFGSFLFGWGGHYAALVGTLGFGGSLMFSAWVHKLKSSPMRFCFFVMVYAIIAAFLHQSTLIGYVAVLALLGMGGFAASMGGLCYAIGFKDEAAVPRGTGVAFLLLFFYVGSRAFGFPDAYLSVFAPAVFFLGSFVFFLGLLILSSKFYRDSSYVVWNAVMLVAAFAAIWLGGVLGVPDLAKMAGSFLVLWALEKWFEIPAGSVLGYSFLTAIGCGIGYFVVQHLMQNHEKFGPYLFFVS